MLMIIALGTVWAYDPLTDQEVQNYWAGLTEEERIDEIRKLDNIEHAIPEISMPVPVLALSGRDILIFYQDGDQAVGYFDIDIAGVLSYRVELEPVTLEKFIPIDWGTYLTITAVGLIAGGIFGYFVSGFF